MFSHDKKAKQRRVRNWRKSASNLFRVNIKQKTKGGGGKTKESSGDGRERTYSVFYRRKSSTEENLQDKRELLKPGSAG